MKDRARELRRNQTKAETLLWSKLRNRQMDGYKFRRQKVIEPYIVDFVCMKLRLIVELDGGHHAEEEQAEYDEVRTEFLDGMGYRVLRFWNFQVLKHRNDVLESIYQTIQEMEGRDVE